MKHGIIFKFDGWKGGGSLPPFYKDISEISKNWMVEDLFQIEKRGIIIDIGWLPHQDISGNFVGYIIKSYDWDNPIECFITRSPKELNSWLNRAIGRYDFNYHFGGKINWQRLVDIADSYLIHEVFTHVGIRHAFRVIDLRIRSNEIKGILERDINI